MGLTKLKYKVQITAFRENQTLSAAIELAQKFPLEKFDIAEHFEQPDIVLYLEYGYLGLIDVPNLMKRARQYPSSMHFVFSEADWPYPILPGAYPSLSKAFPWAQSWCYLPRTDVDQIARSSDPPRLLFSFLGRAATHPVRSAILRLDGAKSPCVDLADAPKRLPDFNYSRSYRDLICDSKFVLCPRGFGASSIRIFEVMSLGRAPVIISDEWQAPPGIPWKEFAVFAAEKDVMKIPSMLRDLEPEARKMGEFAREAFETYFSQKVFYTKLLETLTSKFANFGCSPEENLTRAWRALRWREVKSVGSRAVALANSLIGK